MSPRQFDIFAHPRKQRPPLEKELAQMIGEFLGLHGWSVYRVQSGLFSRPGSLKARVRVGAKGMPDYRAERALRLTFPGAMSVLWYETKRKGERPRPEQELWLSRLRIAGACAEWWDDYEEFLKWYYATYKDLR